MKTLEKEIIYFADPMCSWCWGFAPIIAEVKSNIQNGIGCRTIMGGLRPFTKEVMDHEMKEYILGHWKNVHKTSGQPFDFEFNIGEGFVYDTEPASRAVVTIREINPSCEFEYLFKIQEAFYKEIRDISKLEILADIAGTFEIDKGLFKKLFQSQELKALTQKDFNTSKQLGIRGFPTLLKRTGKTLEIVCQGYQSLEAVNSKMGGF